MTSRIPLFCAALVILWLPLGASSASAGSKTPVAFFCAAGPGVAQQDAETVCHEVSVFLLQTYPDHTFTPGGEKMITLEMTVTLSTQRALGLQSAWTDQQGSRTEGQALKSVFYDHGATPVTRRRFFAAFFQLNPVPL